MLFIPTVILKAENVLLKNKAADLTKDIESLKHQLEELGKRAEKVFRLVESMKPLGLRVG